MNSKGTTDCASLAERLVAAAKHLSSSVRNLKFSRPVTHVYNPLLYAWQPYEMYLHRFGGTRKRVIFIGMNPGPFGMVQTGVPFGEIAAVRDWLKIEGEVGKPAVENPFRPVEGFSCVRSEVSGRRLWNFFADRFGSADVFFAEHFVMNYCPLAFFAEGRNITPDKISAKEAKPLFSACDEHLLVMIKALKPEWMIGVGAWAEERAAIACGGMGLRFGRILHPSPANPAANRDWAGTVLRQLEELGVW